MRRKLAVVLAVVMALGVMGAPAGADVQTERSKSTVLNVFWYSKKKVKGGTLRTTWYVGIYQSGSGLWSDLYQTVERCRRVDGRRRCRTVLSRYGEITDLGEGSFTWSKNLSEAHLEATYPLTTWKAGSPVGGVTMWGVFTEFEGLGDVSKNAYSDSFQSGCSTWRFRSRGVSRNGEAAGTLTTPSGATRDLGETYSAWMYSAKWFSFSRTCDEGGGIE